MCNPAACAKRCTCLEEHEKHLEDICPPDDEVLVMTMFTVGDVVRLKGSWQPLTVIGEGSDVVVACGFNDSGAPFYVTAPHAAFIATEADDEVY